MIFTSFLLFILLNTLYFTFQIPPNINPDVPDAAYAPKLYVIVGIILCLIILFNGFRDTTKARFELDKRFFLYIVVSIVYFISISLIGYYPATFVFLVALMLLLGIRNWFLLTAIPVSFSIFIFVVFDYFIGLPIP